ncbi:hypothetical protein ABTY61_04360 [Kitasatospora sp. NPDC096128]|uniref:hypothetical protein n=1 Tax=Kitasatospora sp. NPDC096128 TaxID=3155547 RepID=UPI003332A22A
MDHAPGQVLRWNFHFGGQLTSCLPMRVVECGPDGPLLWLAAGSPLWKAELPGGRHIRDIPPESHPAYWSAAEAGVVRAAGEAAARGVSDRFRRAAARARRTPGGGRSAGPGG